MKNSEICAVIPTYNNENTLVDVIDAVLQYVHTVVVINDGSTDNTLDILYSYKEISFNPT